MTWTLGVIVAVSSIVVGYLINGLVGWANEKERVSEKIGEVKNSIHDELAGVKGDIKVLVERTESTNRILNSVKQEIGPVAENVKAEVYRYLRDELTRVDKRIDRLEK